MKRSETVAAVWTHKNTSVLLLLSQRVGSDQQLASCLCPSLQLGIVCVTCLRVGDGNWSINAKHGNDLEGPLKMTNHQSHQRGSERWRAREASWEKMKTKEDCWPICVKVRARVMNTRLYGASNVCFPPAAYKLIWSDTGVMSVSRKYGERQRERESGRGREREK